MSPMRTDMLSRPPPIERGGPMPTTIGEGVSPMCAEHSVAPSTVETRVRFRFFHGWNVVQVLGPVSLRIPTGDAWPTSFPADYRPR